MPNRIIKDSIHTSDTVNQMTDFQFRLWVNLITYVDDYGRGDARPAVIRGACFPLRERLTNKDVEAALDALAGIGCVGLYEVDGRPYLYFPTWESHQTIRNKKSKWPAPGSDSKLLQTIENNCNQLQANVPVIQSEYESNPNTNPNPNPNTNPNPNPNTNPNPNPNTNVCAQRTTPTRFTPPSVDDVREFCNEKGYRIDAQHFIDYYEANGWKVGRNPMKDWKAAVRMWASRDNGNGGGNNGNGIGTSEDAQKRWGNLSGIRVI